MTFASKTMRIDLIPEIADVPLARAPQQLVVRATSKGASGREKNEGTIEATYRDLFHSVYDAGFITDLRGRVEDVNRRAVDFFGFSMDEFRNLKVEQLVSGADSSLIDTLHGNLERERFTLIQAFCIRKEGTFFPTEIAVSRIKEKSDHLCFFVRDISVRREAEEMLRTEHQAIQNAVDGIAMTDVDGRLEYVNPAVARLWKYPSADELLDMHLGGLFEEQEMGDEIVRNVVNTKNQSWRGELEALRSDGERFPVAVSAVRNRNTDGETVGVVLSLSDQSDHRIADLARRETERQRVMLESLGTACHHLGQPATVLAGSLDLLKIQLAKADKETLELVEMAVDAYKQLETILERLREVQTYQPTHYLPEDRETEEPYAKILEI